MRLLICAGGTGGGVYPALAVLQAVKRLESGGIGVNHRRKEFSRVVDIKNHDVLWVGSETGMERDLVERIGLPYSSITAAGIHGVEFNALPGNVRKLVKGYFQSKRILEQYRPDVLFFTGGYIAVPMAMAGSGYPSLLFVPDIEPGLASKMVTRFAKQIDLTAEESKSYYKKEEILAVTGYPTRMDLISWDKDTAYTALGLSPELKTLLVLGGSKGAQSINTALLEILPDLLISMQVVHISGQFDWENVKRASRMLKEAHAKADRYHPFKYLHEEIGAAFTVADLVVSRAGASILGEYPLFGLPAIIVPYPHAWRYQIVNAEYLANKGAAVIIKDEELTDQLLSQILLLVSDDQLRKRMSRIMRELVKIDAADNIAQHLISLASMNKGKTTND
ncbi:MAG: UDP-N-acetylglucosamine--N-acetylmuramyl-(pentapeptide) pyrophosphoryl-undecaprenol N-acetylglucosamine transferase [Anaerolineales bacterium]